MGSTLKRVFDLPASAWLYLATAFAELLLARLRFASKSAKTIVSELQESDSKAAAANHAAAETVDIRLLSWAIAVAARNVPWRSDCLIQAMAADRWMRRHNIEPEFFLGAAINDEGDFGAHAWLRYGELIVTGPGHERFVPLIEPGRR